MRRESKWYITKNQLRKKKEAVIEEMRHKKGIRNMENKMQK